MSTVRYPLDDGVVLEFRDLTWTPTGRLFCQVVAFAPDGLPIANAKCEMSASKSRYEVAQEISSHNGAKPDIWADALMAAWHSLDEQRRDAAERFTLESLSEAAEPGPLEFVWNPFIPADFPSNFYGDGGASKSTVIMGLSVAITQGLPFLGRPTKRGAVCFLDWELDQATFLRRLYAICRGMGLSHPPRDLYSSRLTEPLSYHLDDIIDACQRINPVLVVLDSLGPAAAADPNDAEAFIKVTQDLRKLGRASAVVDHQSKGSGQNYRSKRAIGTGYKDFLVRGGIQLELAENVPGRSSVVLRHSKHNFTAEHEPIAFHIRYGIGVISFELGEITEGSFAEADLLPLPLRVLRVLEESAHAVGDETLREASGAGSKQSLKNAVAKLRRQGHEVKTIQGANRSVSYYLGTVTDP